MSATRWKTPEEVAARRLELLDREAMAEIVKNGAPTPAQKQRRAALEQQLETARAAGKGRA